ncbi:hypothetical protein SB748_28740 [Rhizobium sp. SIMBA_035]
MRALSHDSPLREKYLAWIADLIAREATAADNNPLAASADNKAPIRNGAAAPEPVVSVEVPAIEISIISENVLMSQTVAEACRTARNENRLLRQMLARFGQS